MTEATAFSLGIVIGPTILVLGVLGIAYCAQIDSPEKRALERRLESLGFRRSGIHGVVDDVFLTATFPERGEGDVISDFVLRARRRTPGSALAWRDGEFVVGEGGHEALVAFRPDYRDEIAELLRNGLVIGRDELLLVTRGREEPPIPFIGKPAGYFRLEEDQLLDLVERVRCIRNELDAAMSSEPVLELASMANAEEDPAGRLRIFEVLWALDAEQARAAATAGLASTLDPGLRAVNRVFSGDPLEVAAADVLTGGVPVPVALALLARLLEEATAARIVEVVVRNDGAGALERMLFLLGRGTPSPSSREILAALRREMAALRRGASGRLSTPVYGGTLTEPTRGGGLSLFRPGPLR